MDPNGQPAVQLPTIQIVLTPDGNLQVGSNQDLLTTLGMLTRAAHAVQANHEKQAQQSPIQIVRGRLPGHN